MSRFSLLLLKRRIEDLLMFPLILRGRYLSGRKALGADYDYFFFFPFYHTGGVEKFNAALAAAYSGRRCIIFFTRQSVNETFLEAFRKTGHRLVDISRYTDNKLFYFNNIIHRGLVAGWINRQGRAPVVVNGQSNFGYKLSPWLRKDIRQVEIIHTFSSFSYIRTPFLPFYQLSLSPGLKTVKDHLAYYTKIGVPAEYATRFHHAVSGIPLNASHPLPDMQAAELKVLYAGRGGPEKRVHLVAQMAAAAAEKKLPLRFEMAGDVEAAIPANLHPYCKFHGNIADPAAMEAIYSQCHLLILSSAFEGFPLVVMEGMAAGLVILSTPVGDLPLHLKEGENGHILKALENEEEVVQEGVLALEGFCRQRALLQSMSALNRNYALATFGMESFAARYLQWIDSVKIKKD